MGLEVTELLMRVEETFGIALDEGSSDVCTVGDLYRFILAKLGKAEAEQGEARQESLAKVRTLLAEALDIEEDRIQPETLVRDIVPPGERKRLWPEIERTLGRPLPPLVRSKKEVWFTVAVWLLFVAGSCAAFAGVDIWLGSNISAWLSLFLILLGTPIYTYVAQAVTKNWAVHLSDETLTVRHLADLACQARANARLPDGLCLTPKVFFTLRKALVAQFGVPRKGVRPERAMEELIPREARRRQWRALAAALGWQLPDLARPAWVVWLAVILGAGVCLAAGAAIDARTHHALEIWACAVMLLALASIYGYGAALMTRPLAFRFASDAATVEDLMHSALKHNYRQIAGDGAHLGSLEVWNILKAMICEISEAKPEAVTPAAHFYRDLGMG